MYCTKVGVEMIKKTKKKNPNDATFRNIDALKKRVDKVEQKLTLLISTLKFLKLEEK